MTSDTAPATLNEPLTDKQSAFGDRLMAGSTQQQAYRDTHNAAGMSYNAIAVEASRLAHHPKIALMLQARRDAASQAVDDAVVAARLAAPVHLERLMDVAALPIAGEEADTRALPSIKGAAETLLGIAEVIPKAGPVVDARSITVNMGGRDERLAGYSVEQLSALIEELEAREAGSGAVEALGEPSG